MQVLIEMPAEPEAVALARDVVARVASDLAAPEPRIEDLRLLTSKVVTNPLRHGGLASGGSIEVAVEAYPDRVRVEVADPGPGFDPNSLEEPSAEKPGGWGLFLVKKLADRVGRRQKSSDRVWFELSL